MQKSFSIIGTGNMAWFLAEKLSAAGHRFLGVYGRNMLKANRIAETFNGIVFPSISEIKDCEDHFCFIAVKDNAIAEMAAQMNCSKTILIHTSGASSIAILQASAKHYGSFWPIYSIIQSNKSLPKDIPIAIEGNNLDTQNALLEIAKSISNNAFEACEKQRNSLHLAAVFANNFTNHLLAIAEDICDSEKISFDYLKPILKQTFDRLSSQTAKESQTGPAIRADVASMQSHLDQLKNQENYRLLYQSLSDSIRKMYTQNEE
jgi:predicted short-subunit dehydrogenase-like oxidoreductase (DUF2520 family)